MRFALDSSHQDFAASIDALLTKSDMPAVIRSWNDGDTEPGKKLWQRLAETGVNGLVISEEHDGLGADAVDLVVALEQLGRHAVPGPVVETIAVAPTLLASVAPERLSALAEGSLATVAAPPRTPFALDADAVDLVLLAQDGAVSLGVPGEAKASVDLSRKLYEVSAGESLGSADFSAAFDMGALATAAQLQGLGQATWVVLDQLCGAGRAHEHRGGLEPVHGLAGRVFEQLGRVAAQIASLKRGVGHRRAAWQTLDHGEQQVGIRVALGRMQYVMQIAHGGGHTHCAHMGRSFVSPERQLHGGFLRFRQPVSGGA